MMKIRNKVMAVAAALAAVVVLSSTGANASARARPYNWLWNYYDEKWCHSSMDSMTECRYPTLEQCNIARSGVGGSCNPNPRYVDRAPVRVYKRHRYAR